MQQEQLTELVTDLSKVFPLPIQTIQHHQLLHRLENHVDHLINNDFNELILLLYKLDISETKLRQILEQTEAPAAIIIATMIIERQLQKIEARKAFKNDENITDDEKW